MSTHPLDKERRERKLVERENAHFKVFSAPGHNTLSRLSAAMLATYVGKYVLEALDIYHFMGRVDC